MTDEEIEVRKLDNEFTKINVIKNSLKWVPANVFYMQNQYCIMKSD